MAGNEIVGGNSDYVDCLQYLYKGRLMARLNSDGNEKILFYIEKEIYLAKCLSGRKQ